MSHHQTQLGFKMPSQRIAIVGAGFAGLAVCYYLLRDFPCHVTLFDAQGIGSGASGIAAGLAHPYPGKENRLSWRGKQALQATKELLNVAATCTGNSCYRTGLYRVATTQRQEKQFRMLASKHLDDLKWRQASLFEKSMLLAQQGLFLPFGMTVDVNAYLKGLWAACEKLGAVFVLRAVSIADLAAYDQVIIAAGAKSHLFFPKDTLPLKINKGQLLQCEHLARHLLETSVIGNGYLAFHPAWNYCYLGSTYEHNFQSEDPCLETAKPLILNRAAAFMRCLPALKIVGCAAGLRAVHQKCYHPIVDRLTHAMWLFTGLGSRGLLYHAYLGHKLATALINREVNLLPQEVRIRR
ncbi:MAG: FAD-binding oxidoreductase [Chlamydiota bacterium]